MRTIRIHVSALYALARAEGMDRFFRTPRSKVGAFETAELDRIGASGDVALLPMRGARWPESALRRASEIAHETFRSMARAMKVDVT